jgi:DNA-binding PucR family transcriptional regulator
MTEETDRLRRRAAELEALFSTARELVRLQDVDEVLRRLVDRAHDLMGTDVTYLSELVDGGLLHVRFSAGTVTPEFRDLRVPTGFGLANLVVRTREPAWVREYASMDETPHHPYIDAAVRGEGLVAFLGVPLAVGDEVLGALFACNRSVHDFTPDEVLLLSAFADHAASVLYGARQRAELERLLAASRLESGIHEELTAVVMSGGTVLEIAATLARRLDRRVWALDHRGRPLPGFEGPLPEGVADALARAHASGHAEVTGSGEARGIVAAIPGADRLLGGIVAEGADDVARAAVERGAQVAALVSFQQEAVSAVRAERRERWLLDLVEGREPTEAGPDAITGCAVLERRASAATLAANAAGDDGIVATREGRILVAWTHADPIAATERVRRLIAETARDPGVTAVALARDLASTELRAAFERAGRDLDLVQALGVSGSTVSSDALAAYHAIAPADSETLDRFVTELLGPVLDWDHRRRTELLDTLGTYFDAGESRAAAAAALRIHANTVQQRLDRIQTLLAGDLGDPEYRFRVQAAVRLERLRRRLRVPGVGG